MTATDLAEFLFLGAVAVPALLLLAGEPGLAILALVFLLCAACLAALADPGAPFRTMLSSDKKRR